VTDPDDVDDGGGGEGGGEGGEGGEGGDSTVGDERSGHPHRSPTHTHTRGTPPGNRASASQAAQEQQ
jgi:hypothetical protein